MIDRRTYLAGQAMIHFEDNEDHLSVQDLAKLHVAYGDAVLAEIQRTCEHRFQLDHRPLSIQKQSFSCERCGMESGAEKPSGGRDEG